MSAPSPSDPNTLDLPPSQEEVTRQFPAEAATIQPDARPAAPPPAQVPGYEILGELGRGGMGVVYKARHLKLNRVVALKMILSGGHAGEAERGRFLTEAQSIARLQHPNVVQVFEVGECEGRPFFSMEFCAGGGLDKRLSGTPLPPREAATLVATLARAMQAAHDHGIVHRDLKPANVLLSVRQAFQPDSSGNEEVRLESLTYNPKVTDFGLAKKLDERGQTLSGAIMGTPSYVAPEQAEGKKIGPAVDVYALGAILYECLTGRPPFKAATAMETLRQVTSQEAVPPHQLNAGVPRDLETVTLKCLQKDPTRRYASADALAADLSRWLAGEPILARPVSPLMRAAKWVRRRPALATLAGVSAAALLALLAVSVAFNVRLRQEKRAALYERDQAELERAEANRQRDEADKQRREADTQRQQARENFRLARAAVDEYAKKAAEDPRLKERGVQEVRKEWLQAAERFYQKFVDQAGDDPEVRLEQARAYGRLAAISAEISTVAEAEKHYLQARKLWQKLLDDFPTRVECRVELAGVIAGLGGLAKERGQMVRAEQLLLEAHKAAVQLAEDHPAGHADHYKFQAILAASHNQLALYYKDARKLDLAEKQLLRTIELASKLPADKEKELEASVLVAISRLNLGDVYQNQGRYDMAEAAYDAARDSFEKRRQQGKLSADHRKVLALMHVTRAILYYKRGDAPRAGKAYHEAASLLEELAREQPHVLDVQNSLGATLMMMGVHYFDMGQTSTAAGYYERASVIQERLYLNFPQVKQYRTNRLSGLTALAMLYFSTRQAKPCEEKLDRALAAARELVEAHPEDAEMKAKLADVRVGRRQLFAATGRMPQALAEFREELAIRETLEKQSDSPEHKVALAGCCCNLGNFVWENNRDEAHRLYDRAVQLCTAVLRTDPDHVGAYAGLTKNLNNRADYLTEKKQFAAALADRTLALGVAEQLVCLQPDKASARVQLAYAYRKANEELQVAGRLDEAEAMMVQEIALLQQAVADRLADDKPETCRYQLAESSARLANFYSFQVKGRARDAVRPYRLAVYHYSRLAVTQQDTPYYLTAAGGEACNLAHLLNDQTGQRLESLPWYGRAGWLLKESLRLKPGDATAMRYLRNVHSGQGTALARLGRPAEAVASQAKVVQYYESLIEAKDTVQSRLSLVDGLSWLGDLYGRADRPDDAEKTYAKAAGVCEKCLADEKFGGQARATLAVLYRRRAALHAGKDRTKEAVALFQRERELREALVEAEFDHANQLDALGECLTELASLHVRAKDYPKAARAQAEASSHRRQLVSAHPQHANARALLARSYAAQGMYEKLNDEPAKAIRSLERACEAWDRAVKGRPAAQANAYRDEQDKPRLLWALMLLQLGQPARALELVAVSAERESMPAETAYHAATLSAVASSALVKDAGVPLAVRQKRAGAAARSALGLLERARAGGYFDKADRIKDLFNYDEFASLRQRDDFKAWVKKLEARD